jgi:hypothetical protein
LPKASACACAGRPAAVYTRRHTTPSHAHARARARAHTHTHKYTNVRTRAGVDDDCQDMTGARVSSEQSRVKTRRSVCVQSPASRNGPPPGPPPPAFMPPACSPSADESMAKQKQTCTRRSKRARMQCAGAKVLVQKEDRPARIGRSRGGSQRHLVGGHCLQPRLHPACERRGLTLTCKHVTLTRKHVSKADRDAL